MASLAKLTSSQLTVIDSGWRATTTAAVVLDQTALSAQPDCQDPLNFPGRRNYLQGDSEDSPKEPRYRSPSIEALAYRHIPVLSVRRIVG